MQNDPSPQPRIIPVLQAHLDSIADLERNCFPSPWKRDYFAMELNQDNRFNCSLLMNDSLIGYFFSYYVIPEIHISKIAVSEEFQRCGYANMLMEKFQSFSNEKGIVSATLEVRISNQPALQFYRRWGFEILHVRKSYYDDGEDALVMKGVL